MAHILISSPGQGGLFKINLENKKQFRICSGNIRGISTMDNSFVYVQGNKNSVFDMNQKELFSFNGNSSLHDVKFFKCKFYIISTEEKKMLTFTYEGGFLNELKFDNCYWPNCCLIDPVTENVIIFLSAKRPYSKSKIICCTKDLVFLWEYYCLEGDEIHSPFLVGDTLFWCRSNYNSIVKASLSKQLRDIRKVIINNGGYVRGLCIHDDKLYLGTSENRHAATSLCTSEFNCGCIHSYFLHNDSYAFDDMITLPVKEVYDIVYYDKDPI